MTSKSTIFTEGKESFKVTVKVVAYLHELDTIQPSVIEINDFIYATQNDAAVTKLWPQFPDSSVSLLEKGDKRVWPTRLHTCLQGCMSQDVTLKP